MDDAPLLFHLRSDPEVTKYLDRHPAQSIDEARSLIALIESSFANNEGISWAITLKDRDDLIGSIGLWRIDKENHRGEIGYMLLPVYFRQGYMTESINAVLGYGYNSMNLHSVEANVNPANEASIAILEKSGFRKEAHFRENYYFDGRFLDSAIYSLLHSDFIK